MVSVNRTVVEALPSEITAEQRIELIAGLCTRAATHGLKVSIEFLPWSPIGNLTQAVALADAVGQSDFGVNIDLWHHFRSGGTLSQLRSLAPGAIAAVQVNDIAPEPWEDVTEETSLGRKLPGEGVGETAECLGALYTSGVRGPINVEVFSAELMGQSALEAARRLKGSLTRVLQSID